MPKRTTPTILDAWRASEIPTVLTPARRAIRAKCLDCCGNLQAEVARCDERACPLWPYRFGAKAKPQTPPKAVTETR